MEHAQLPIKDLELQRHYVCFIIKCFHQLTKQRFRNGHQVSLFSNLSYSVLLIFLIKFPNEVQKSFLTQQILALHLQFQSNKTFLYAWFFFFLHFVTVPHASGIIIPYLYNSNSPSLSLFHMMILTRPHTPSIFPWKNFRFVIYYLQEKLLSESVCYRGPLH